MPATAGVPKHAHAVDFFKRSQQARQEVSALPRRRKAAAVERMGPAAAKSGAMTRQAARSASASSSQMKTPSEAEKSPIFSRISQRFSGDSDLACSAQFLSGINFDSHLGGGVALLPNTTGLLHFAVLP